MDFENDRVKEIHTNYNGEPYSVGWNDLNVKKQLSKVKPISTTIQIINEQDIYNILTNKEKLEYLLHEYEKKNNHQLDKEQQVCCHQNTPCVNSNNKEKLSCGILPIEGNQPQANKIEDEDHNIDYSHRGKMVTAKIIQT